jgi:hypothetical protein
LFTNQVPNFIWDEPMEELRPIKIVKPKHKTLLF